MLDLLIKNAVLVCAETGREIPASVGIENGRIKEIRERSYSECSGPAAPNAAELPEAREILDAGGMCLLPGLVDFHTHLFRHGSSFGMDADLLLSSGVTAAADMGSAGWVNYPAMHDCDLAGKKLLLKSFLNISPVGQPGRGIAEPLDDGVISEEGIRKILEEYPGCISGLKVRLSRGIVKEHGIRPLARALELGNVFGLPVCVHTTDPPVPMDQVASMLRPGDILSHMYHRQGHHAAESAGVLDGMLKAQARGVLMEVGNGTRNFNFQTAEQCLAAGLRPDIISSDATPMAFHSSPAMWDLARVMSKFLNLGVPLQEVIRAATATPAKALRLVAEPGAPKAAGLGAEPAAEIMPGAPADLALFRMDPEETLFCDSDGNERRGPRGLVPLMTVIGGKIVWKDQAL